MDGALPRAPASTEQRRRTRSIMAGSPGWLAAPLAWSPGTRAGSQEPGRGGTVTVAGARAGLYYSLDQHMVRNPLLFSFFPSTEQKAFLLNVTTAVDKPGPIPSIVTYCKHPFVGHTSDDSKRTDNSRRTEKIHSKRPKLSKFCPVVKYKAWSNLPLYLLPSNTESPRFRAGSHPRRQKIARFIKLGFLVIRCDEHLCAPPLSVS